MSDIPALDRGWAKLGRLSFSNWEKLPDGGFRQLRHQVSTDVIERGFKELDTLAGHPLPTEIRELLSRYGNASIRSDVVCALPPKCPLGKRIALELLNSPVSDGKYPIAKELAKYRSRIPDNMLPISTDPGGNLFVYSLAGSDASSVYAWDHEYRALPKGSLDRMVEELDRQGFDTQQMSQGSIIRQWEELNASKLGRPVGYGPLYLLAPSLAQFIERLEVIEDD